MFGISQIADMSVFDLKFENASQIVDEQERDQFMTKVQEEQMAGIDANFSTLLQVVRNHCPKLYTVLRTYEEGGQETGGEYYYGMKEAPAAKGFHHAYEGGLVQHYLEMLHVAGVLCQSIEHFRPLTEKEIVFAVVAHDLHKAYAHFSYDGTKFMYANNSTTKLMTPDQKTIYMLSHCGVRLSVEEINSIFSSGGGYAKAPPPMQTVLSKFVYLLDEHSVLIDRIRAGRWRANIDVQPSFFLKELQA
jgi:hypothetical protein